MPFGLPSLGRRAALLCAISGALALGVSACGSSSSSSSTNASAGAGGTSTTSSTARYEARLNYAKCMRAHGVNVPDPSASGGPGGGGGGAGGAGGAGGFQALRNSPNYQSASTACAKYRSKAFSFGNASPATQAKFTQDLVKFAECMRSHNINIPDPTTTGGAGGAFQIFRQLRTSESNSPAFQSALKACSTDIPFRRGGGAGGPGGPGGGGNPGA
jgi:hypothetical protein